jgi:hypothetical protein
LAVLRRRQRRAFLRFDVRHLQQQPNLCYNLGNHTGVMPGRSPFGLSRKDPMATKRRKKKAAKKAAAPKRRRKASKKKSATRKKARKATAKKSKRRKASRRKKKAA